METVTVVAAILAAIAGTIGAVYARRQWRESRRARLESIVENVTLILDAVRWGPTASLKRDELQRTLKARLVGLDLPKVKALTMATLHSDKESE